MRSIAIFAGLVIMLCAQPALAQDERPYAFSLGTQFGFFYGQVEEIVYPPSQSQYKADLLSQLLWDMKPVFYSGLVVDLSRRHPLEKWGGFSSLSFKYGFPGKSGKMEDRDWLSTENNELTIFSTHDNYTDRLILIDLSAGFSFPLRQMVLLKAYLNLSYSHLSFSGIGGYGIRAKRLGNGKYASIDDDPDYFGPFGDEKVISYTQNWFHIAPGVSLSFFFLERFSTELFFAISPIVYCDDDDRHLTTNTQYTDNMQGGIIMEPGINFSFSANKWIELTLGCSLRYINRIRGDTYQRSPIGTGTYTQSGEAGAGLSNIDTGLSLKIHF
jgi:outer membrane protease